ncbi:MAG: hypothetical protein ACOC8B_03705 [Gemmatimonadota bacterium]
MEELRTLIRGTTSDVTERISYGMPTFDLSRLIDRFARVSAVYVCGRLRIPARTCPTGHLRRRRVTARRSGES